MFKLGYLYISLCTKLQVHKATSGKQEPFKTFENNVCFLQLFQQLFKDFPANKL